MVHTLATYPSWAQGRSKLHLTVCFLTYQRLLSELEQSCFPIPALQPFVLYPSLHSFSNHLSRSWDSSVYQCGNVQTDKSNILQIQVCFQQHYWSMKVHSRFPQQSPYDQDCPFQSPHLSTFPHLVLFFVVYTRINSLSVFRNSCYSFSNTLPTFVSRFISFSR